MNDPQITKMTFTTGDQTVTNFPSFRYPKYHFFPWGGNYVSCNMYWALGMKCPHCAEESR